MTDTMPRGPEHATGIGRPAVEELAGVAQKRSLVSPILGLIGGALLVLGSFLPWVTVSADAARLELNLARAMGVPPSLIAGSAGGDVSYTFSGVHDGGDGVVTLVVGVAVAVLAVVIFRSTRRTKALGTLLILAGLICAALALYDLSAVADARDQAIARAISAVGDTGLDKSVFDGVFKMSAGVGIYVCVVGGVLAMIAGILARARKATAGASTDEAAATGVSVPPS